MFNPIKNTLLEEFVLETFKSVYGLGDLITQTFDNEDADTNFGERFNDILIKFFDKLDCQPDLMRQKLNRPKEQFEQINVKFNQLSTSRKLIS